MVRADICSDEEARVAILGTEEIIGVDEYRNDVRVPHLRPAHCPSNGPLVKDDRLVRLFAEVIPSDRHPDRGVVVEESLSFKRKPRIACFLEEIVRGTDRKPDIP